MSGKLDSRRYLPRNSRLWGFTLAELIVVVAVLSILAVIGFLSLSGYSQDAKNSAVKTNVRGIYTTISAESAITGNSPRYYITHDDAASLSGAFVIIDGNGHTALTGGSWNQAGTNYSAGNPDYVRLKLNREKFKISSFFENFEKTAFAGYSQEYLAVGAMDATVVVSGGKTRQVSYYQVAGLAPETSTAFVVGNFPDVGTASGSASGLIKSPGDTTGTGALTDGAAVSGTNQTNGGNAVYDPVITVSANPNLPVGRLGKPYNSGLGFDLKTLLSVTGDPTYSASSVVWTLSGSTLPTGLTLASNGTIAGTPSALTSGAGTSFTAVATYSGKNGQQSYVLKVGNAVLEVVDVAVGYGHTCAVLVDGRVKCWGFGDQGQLGNSGSGATYKSLVPVAVVNAVGGTEMTGAVDVEAGYSFTCARLSDGKAKCWGHGGYGQLGNNGSLNSASAVEVKVTGGTSSLTGTTSLALYQNTACATVSGGGLKCWGQGTSGQLGIGLNTNKLVATDVLSSASVPISGISSISLGYAHACAVTDTGGAKCWGANASYQLGTGNNSAASYPTDVLVSAGGAALAGVSKISAGYLNTCAVMSNGGVKCWGDNTQAQCGDGTLLAKYVPTDVLVAAGGAAFTGATSIKTGNYHSCVTTDAGGSKCWGRNAEGQLGDGTTVQKKVPVPVLASVGGAPASGIASVTLYALHTCAEATDSTIACWGNGTNGELGNGLTSSSTVPTEVLE